MAGSGLSRSRPTGRPRSRPATTASFASRISSRAERPGEFETHNAWDWSVAFSPDGHRALTGSGDGVGLAGRPDAERPSRAVERPAGVRLRGCLRAGRPPRRLVGDRSDHLLGPRDAAGSEGPDRAEPCPVAQALARRPPDLVRNQCQGFEWRTPRPGGDRLLGHGRPLPADDPEPGTRPPRHGPPAGRRHRDGRPGRRGAGSGGRRARSSEPANWTPTDRAKPPSPSTASCSPIGRTTPGC